MQAILCAHMLTSSDSVISFFGGIQFIEKFQIVIPLASEHNSMLVVLESYTKLVTENMFYGDYQQMTQ